MTWTRIATTGEAPAVDERMPWFACYGRPTGAKDGRVFNLHVRAPSAPPPLFRCLTPAGHL